MGVKLSALVPKKHITWENLSGKILAVDSSNMLFQFLTSIRQRDGTLLMDSQHQVTSHLVGIASRVSNLVSKGIKPCFVFDGKSPELKIQERERRKKIKIKAQEKYQEAVEEEDVESMFKYSRMTAKLTKDMVEEAKKLLHAMGLPVIQAPSEAEAQASYMCRKKKVWAVASSDYDCLLFHSPRMITNLTLSQKKKSFGLYGKDLEIIELSEVLNNLGVDHDQLLILGILVGTDFNPGGVKGIGPKKALALVQSDKDFQTIFEELNVKFDWKQIFDLLKNMKVIDDYNLDFKEPDENKIKELLIEKHDFSESRVDSMLKNFNKGKDKAQTGLNKWF
ncbi:MAG: flap endonuclease-1 [Nanoarchaeota archaeon]|nr:flap endonuclease-1 [Nanoarchaeota archaeon]